MTKIWAAACLGLIGMPGVAMAAPFSTDTGFSDTQILIPYNRDLVSLVTDASSNAYLLSFDGDNTHKISKRKSDGTLDAAFGTDGVLSLAAVDSLYKGMCVDPTSGDLLLLRPASGSPPRALRAERFDPAGAPVTTWGDADGVSSIDGPGGAPDGYGCNFQNDGSVTIVGSDADPQGGPDVGLVVQLGASGASSTAVVSTVAPALSYSAFRLTVVAFGSSGARFIAGMLWATAGSDVVLIKLAANGTPDTGFNGGNALLLDFGGNDDTPAGLMPLSDGSVYGVAAHGLLNAQISLTIGRILADGTPDAASVVSGSVAFAQANTTRLVTIDKLGRILLGGSNYVYADRYEQMMRLLGLTGLAQAGGGGGGGGGALPASTLLVVLVLAVVARVRHRRRRPANQWH